MTNNGGVMTERELAEILARADAATAGPWHWDDAEEPGELLGSVDVVCDCGEFGSHCARPIIETDGGYYGPCAHDRAFIAHARTDVPALVEEVRRLRKEVAALKRLPYNAEEARLSGVPERVIQANMMQERFR